MNELKVKNLTPHTNYLHKMKSDFMSFKKYDRFWQSQHPRHSEDISLIRQYKVLIENRSFLIKSVQAEFLTISFSLCFLRRTQVDHNRSIK